MPPAAPFSIQSFPRRAATTRGIPLVLEDDEKVEEEAPPRGIEWSLLPMGASGSDGSLSFFPPLPSTTSSTVVFLSSTSSSLLPQTSHLTNPHHPETHSTQASSPLSSPLLFSLRSTNRPPITMSGAGSSTSAAAAVTKTASGSDKGRALAAKVSGSIKDNASKGASHAVKCGSNTCTGFRDFLIKGELWGRKKGALSFSVVLLFSLSRARPRERAKEAAKRKRKEKSHALFPTPPPFPTPHHHQHQQARSSTSPSPSSSARPSPTSSRPLSRPL